MTVPTNVQYGIFEHNAQIERTVKVTRHQNRKACVKSQPVSQNVRYHLQRCATGLLLQFQHITPRQIELILPMLLSYFPTYSFSSVEQQGPKAPHFDVSRSQTHTHSLTLTHTTLTLTRTHSHTHYNYLTLDSHDESS